MKFWHLLHHGWTQRLYAKWKKANTKGQILFNFSCMRYLGRRQWHPTPVVLPGKSHGQRSLVGCSPWGRKTWTRLSDFPFTFHFHALEKEMATHSSVLAWRIPGTGEPGGLLSVGSHRVRHDWSDLAAAAAFKKALHFEAGKCAFQFSEWFLILRSILKWY